jgi:hypothetical protein
VRPISLCHQTGRFPQRRVVKRHRARIFWVPQASVLSLRVLTFSLKYRPPTSEHPPILGNTRFLFRCPYLGSPPCVVCIPCSVPGRAALFAARVRGFCPRITGHGSRIMPQVFSCAGDSTRRKRDCLSSTGHGPRNTVHGSPLLTSSPVTHVSVVHVPSGTASSCAPALRLNRSNLLRPYPLHSSPLIIFLDNLLLFVYTLYIMAPLALPVQSRSWTLPSLRIPSNFFTVTGACPDRLGPTRYRLSRQYSASHEVACGDARFTHPGRLHRDSSLSRAADHGTRITRSFFSIRTRHSSLATRHCLLSPLESAFTHCDALTPLDSALTRRLCT